MKSEIASIPITSPEEYLSAVSRVLDGVNAVEALAGFSRIIVKPNMVNSSPPQVTIDAIEGQVGGHLSGRAPNPPIGRIIVGTDVLAADREAARLLGHNPESIRHLKLAERFM